MSDYFFYDINKKMADLANKQQLAEDAQAAPVKPAPNRLMEAAADYSAKKAAAGKDIGKPGKNFSKIAAGAAKRYGSAEAGKRVAGAVLNKLRHTEESIDQAQLKPWKATMKEGMCSSCNCAPCKCNEGNAFSGAVAKAKRDGIQPGEKVRVGGKQYPLREVDATPQDTGSYEDEVKAANAPQRKASAPRPPVVPPKKTMPPKPKMYPPQAIDEPVKEGGVPMTPKQKKFAALAKPFDKISFADKIVGAKKEVDEMLGDVAADAMKKAVGSRGQSSYQRGQQQDDEFASDHFARARNQRRHDAEDEWARSKGRKPHADMDESWIDDEPTRRRSSSGGEIDTSKPGVTRHTAVKGNYSGAGHDASADDEPSGAVGRRKVGAGMGKKIGAKINRGTSKLMTKEGDMPEDMIEPQDSGEYDREGEMAKDDIKTVVRHAQALEKILGDEDNLPEWVQAKLAKIEGMMTAVDDYMQNQKSGDTDDEEMSEESTNKRDSRAERAGRKVAKDIEYDEKKKDGIHGKRRGSEDSKAERAGRKVTKDIEYDEKHKKNESSDQHFDKGYYDSIDAAKKDNPKSIVKARKQPFEEESTNTRDSRAEKAGRKVAKDIEYDEKKKDGIHGKRRGSEDDKAERAGRKVTKDIEYDEKKKEVDETTSSGSVATSSAAPKSGGGMSYGKGIYDSLNRQLENMISESMTVNMTMNNDDHGGPKKSLTVTATDEDAVMLAGILKMAGMGSGDEHIYAMTGDDSDMDALHDMDHMHSDEEACADCGQTTCECYGTMEEDRWGAEQPPKLPNDMSVTGSGGVNVSKTGSDWVYKSKEPGGRITATIPASASNKMFPNTNVDEAYGDTDATENEPDWPTDEEGTDDAMMYSGGLNGPKSTGQTTVPVISGQKDRMGYEGDHELRRMMEIAGLR